MSIWSLLNSRFSCCFLGFWVVISCFSELILSEEVTLGSIEIFQTHEWLPGKPTVYFQCKGENTTVLPDVKKTNISYAFKGEESWQPLTDLQSKKCKRCGFYEKDLIKADVFDEWEFCSSDFKDGKYTRIKKKEFNATFLCPKCTSSPNASNVAYDSDSDGKGARVAIAILISAVAVTVMIIASVVAYKYWQKKKRQQDQARFLKLFEDGDEMEDELGLGSVI